MCAIGLLLIWPRYNPLPPGSCLLNIPVGSNHPTAGCQGYRDHHAKFVMLASHRSSLARTGLDGHGARVFEGTPLNRSHHGRQ